VCSTGTARNADAFLRRGRSARPCRRCARRGISCALGGGARRAAYAGAFLPRRKPPAALEDHSGRQFTAEARLSVDAAGLIGQIEDALKTADHILTRLSEPQAETHWADTPRLAMMLQNLLEAGGAGDPDFAMELIEKELPGLLRSGGISVVEYSKSTTEYFDELPGIGEGAKIEMAAPALLRSDGSILRRGTIWVRS